MKSLIVWAWLTSILDIEIIISDSMLLCFNQYYTVWTWLIIQADHHGEGGEESEQEEQEHQEGAEVAGEWLW